MSNQNNTRLLLNIKDPNIIFSDNSARKEIVSGIEYNVGASIHNVRLLSTVLKLLP